jgi:hypothetical protein
MVRRVVIALAAVLVTSPAAAAGQGRVTVDWSRVSDADVARCGLSKLRPGTIERLVDSGYAVVGSSDGSELGVVVTSVAGGLRVEVEGGGTRRDDTLRYPEPCDTTFVLEAIDRIAELVGEVARQKPVAPPAFDGPPVPGPPPPIVAAGWQAGVDFTSRASHSGDVFLGGGLSGRDRFIGGWEGGLRAELTASIANGVTVFEPFLGFTGAWQAETRGAGPYLELGPLLHLAHSDTLSA